ncbi:hypothetical protein EAI_07370 [Harpegnathos saltator]|uniref:Uncharacterized protein n=1 Tax=Harpegnathos saltator TaxID=610380 RepID=E2BIF7_HARSA|nr:hypothetical protein EAI_07370 [Harpegnathos saltator]
MSEFILYQQRVGATECHLNKGPVDRGVLRYGFISRDDGGVGDGDGVSVLVTVVVRTERVREARLVLGSPRPTPASYPTIDTPTAASTHTDVASVRALLRTEVYQYQVNLDTEVSRGAQRPPPPPPPAKASNGAFNQEDRPQTMVITRNETPGSTVDERGGEGQLTTFIPTRGVDLKTELDEKDERTSTGAITSEGSEDHAGRFDCPRAITQRHATYGTIPMLTSQSFNMCFLVIFRGI